MIKEKEKRMITARDAYKATQDRIQKMSSKAEEFAKSEFDTYLEAATMKAVEAGQMEAKYYWSFEVFEDAEVDVPSFRSAIRDMFEELGYGFQSEYTIDALRIWWDWRSHE